MTRCDICGDPRREFPGLRLETCRTCEQTAQNHPEIYGWVLKVQQATIGRVREMLGDHQQDFNHESRRPW